MDATKRDSPLHPWRERWRELGARVKGARPRRDEAEDRRGEVSGRTIVALHPSRQASAASWMDAVEEARQDWMHARSYFDAVEDPDLIDHAIYQVQAAESRYMYLLRKVRKSYQDREGKQLADRSLVRSPSS